MVGKSPSARTAILARTAKEKTSAKIAKLKKQNLQNSLVCEQMDVAAADAFAAFINLRLYFIHSCCFTDKFVLNATRLHLRCLG
jgi:hypothetical protein